MLAKWVDQASFIKVAIIRKHVTLNFMHVSPRPTFCVMVSRLNGVRERIIYGICGNCHVSFCAHYACVILIVLVPDMYGLTYPAPPSFISPIPFLLKCTGMLMHCNLTLDIIEDYIPHCLPAIC